MTPLSLVALLAFGADPTPGPYIPAECPMRERPRFVLRRAYDRIKEKADALPARQQESAEWAIVPVSTGVRRGQGDSPAVAAYELQPGDMVLSADTSRFWQLMHHLAGTATRRTR